jgi:hypothetical protein
MIIDKKYVMTAKEYLKIIPNEKLEREYLGYLKMTTKNVEDVVYEHIIENELRTRGYEIDVNLIRACELQ